MMSTRNRIRATFFRYIRQLESTFFRKPHSFAREKRTAGTDTAWGCKLLVSNRYPKVSVDFMAFWPREIHTYKYQLTDNQLISDIRGVRTYRSNSAIAFGFAHVTLSREYACRFRTVSRSRFFGAWLDACLQWLYNAGDLSDAGLG